jgi:hypothetical protein
MIQQSPLIIPDGTLWRREEQTLDSLELLTQSLSISQRPLPLQKTSKITNPVEQPMQGLRPRQKTTANGFKSIKPTDVTSFSLEWRRAELGNEARKYVQLLARLSGGSMGAEIQRIYQQIAVEFQTARANQVTRNRFVLRHPPPQPRGP